jgi:succinate-acetate transporter protein
MDRMFRVLGFWTAIFTVMLYVGGLNGTALLFLAQTIFFVVLSYLKLTERMYIYVFGAYLTVFFVGFTYYSTFILVPSFGE